MVSVTLKSDALDTESEKAFLGEGCCGKVYAVSHERAGMIAWKEFNAMSIDRHWVEEYDRCYSQADERHPGVLHRHGSDFSARPAICISDLATGNDGTAKSAKKLDSLAFWTEEKDIWPYLIDLASACEFLHRNHIVHGNLHPANIFIGQGGSSLVAVSDFGQGYIGKVHHFDFSDGLWFTAPEQLRNPEGIAEQHGYRWDVYSFGVIAYWLITGTLPRGENYSRASLEALDTARKHGRVSDFGAIDPLAFAEAIEQSTDPVWPKKADTPHIADLRAIVDGCLSVDPCRRPVDMREVHEKFQKLESSAKLIGAGQGVDHERQLQMKKRLSTCVAFAGAVAVACLVIFGFVRYFGASNGDRGSIDPLSATIEGHHVKMGEFSNRLQNGRHDLATSRAAADRYFAAIINEPGTDSNGLSDSSVEETRAYYKDVLAKAEGDPDASVEAALAHHGLARLKLQTQSPAAAAASIESTIAVLEAALDSDAINPSEEVDLHLRLADCHEILSRMHAVAPSEAVLDSLIAAVRHIADARSRLPYDHRLAWQHAVLDHHLAIEQHAQRRFGNAIETHAAAVKILQSITESGQSSDPVTADELGESGDPNGLSPATPVASEADHRKLLAGIQFHTGLSLCAAKRCGEAIDAYRSAIETLTGGKDPAQAAAHADLSVRVMLARCYAELGAIFSAEKEAEKAREVLTEAIHRLVPLASIPAEGEPETEISDRKVDAVLALADSYRRLACLEDQDAHSSEALRLHRSAIDIIEAAIAERPERIDLYFSLAQAHTACGSHFGSGTAAKNHLEDAHGLAEQLREIVADEEAKYGQGLQQTRIIQIAQLYAAIGDLCADLSENDRAKSCYSIAVGKWTLLADSEPRSETWFHDLLSKTKSRLDSMQ